MPPQNLITTLSSITDHANKLTVLCSKRAATRAVGPGGEASSSTKRHLELQDQDLLDGEGVNIWNRSGEYKTTDQQGLQDVYAASELTLTMGRMGRRRSSRAPGQPTTLVWQV